MQGGDVPEIFEDYYTGTTPQIGISEEGARKSHQKNGEFYQTVSKQTHKQTLLHMQ